jgi:hypothetical protein
MDVVSYLENIPCADEARLAGFQVAASDFHLQEGDVFDSREFRPTYVLLADCSHVVSGGHFFKYHSIRKFTLP